MIGFGNLKSPDSDVNTTIAFDFQVEAELIWFDQNGKPVSYGHKKGAHNQPTYVGHVWEVRTHAGTFGPYIAERPPAPRIVIPPRLAPAPAPGPSSPR